ncbi:MAG: M48 family metalloprotease [Solirubrobacteraceae bacterium]
MPARVAASRLAVAAGAAALLARALTPRAPAGSVSAAACEEHFSAQEVRRARRFGRPQLGLHVARLLIESAVCLAAVKRDRGRSIRSRTAAGASGAALMLACELAPLPLSAVMRRRAVRAGLVTQSWSGWAADIARSAAIAAPLAGAAAVLGRELVRRRGDGWWLPAAAIGPGAATALTFASPLLLDPLFNDFTPLADGALRDDVFELARRAGVRLRGVYVVDASRRTTAANAYVNGLWWSRRVVLFDTLLESFTQQETRLVVAHELAHVRHRDVPRSLLFLALSAPGAMWAAAAIVRASGGAGIPALGAALGVVQVPLGMLGNRISRAVEVRADLFALELAGGAADFISFERRIALQNLIDPDPPHLLQSLLGTHPTTLERIGLAAAFTAPPKAARGPRTPAGS